MNSRQIESWALRVIDGVKNGQPNEDSLVELKREWISGEKAARRIAGHANAARGENILWLIGVDEKLGKQCVIGASANDLSSWYPTVEACFDELAPRMIPLNIPIDGLTVVALLFETDRSPFVIKNAAYGSQGGGSVELEVPWRESTSVRSARRSEIIRLLAPLELLPDIEILDSKLMFYPIRKGQHNLHSLEQINSEPLSKISSYCLKLIAGLYIVPRDRSTIVIPFHRCRVNFEILGDSSIWQASQIVLNPANGHPFPSMFSKLGSLTIQSTLHEIIIDGSGRISLEASLEINFLPDFAKDTIMSISISLLPAGADRSVILTQNLPCQFEGF